MLKGMIIKWTVLLMSHVLRGLRTLSGGVATSVTDGSHDALLLAVDFHRSRFLELITHSLDRVLR